MTINEAVFSYLKTSTTMQSTFNGLFYIRNNNEVKQPYATIYMVGDPKDVEDICVTDQGQARFQCDTFSNSYDDGVDKREIYQTVVKSLDVYSVTGLKIWKVDIMNVVDRADTIDELYQFSFEAIIYWYKTS